MLDFFNVGFVQTPCCYHIENFTWILRFSDSVSPPPATCWNEVYLSKQSLLSSYDFYNHCLINNKRTNGRITAVVMCSTNRSTAWSLSARPVTIPTEFWSFIWLRHRDRLDIALVPWIRIDEFEYRPCLIKCLEKSIVTRIRPVSNTKPDVFHFFSSEVTICLRFFGPAVLFPSMVLFSSHHSHSTQTHTHTHTARQPRPFCSEHFSLSCQYDRLWR